MLVDMLEASKTFQSLTNEEQVIYKTLAAIFQSSPDNIFKTPEDLSLETDRGTPVQWSNLLSMEPVLNYIKQEMTANTRIAQRKAFQSLQMKAQLGDVSAIKHIDELSGIFNRQDSNKVVVLHYVNRQEIKN